MKHQNYKDMEEVYTVACTKKIQIGMEKKNIV